MNRPYSEVLDGLLTAYSGLFNIYRKEQLPAEEQAFDARADFHSRSEKYVAVKRAQIWAYEANEYLYFAHEDALDEAGFARLWQGALAEGRKRVAPHKEHMYSYISLVILSRDATPAVRKAVARVRARKNFKLSFFGWMELRVALIDLANGDVTTNRAGREMKKPLARFAFGE